MKAELEPVLIINNFVEGITECIITQVTVYGAAALHPGSVVETWSLSLQPRLVY